MSFGRVVSLIGVTLLVMVTNIVASILYMVVYGYVIDPGHEAQYYEDHIQVAGPYCSIVAGIPLMFLAGWWVAGWSQGRMGVRGALIVWLAYFVIDLSVVLAVGVTMQVAVLVAISFATKLVAAWCGAWTRLRGQAEPDAAAVGGG